MNSSNNTQEDINELPFKLMNKLQSDAKAGLLSRQAICIDFHIAVCTQKAISSTIPEKIEFEQYAFEQVKEQLLPIDKAWAESRMETLSPMVLSLFDRLNNADYCSYGFTFGPDMEALFLLSNAGTNGNDLIFFHNNEQINILDTPLSLYITTEEVFLSDFLQDKNTILEFDTFAEALQYTVETHLGLDFESCHDTCSSCPRP